MIYSTAYTQLHGYGNGRVVAETKCSSGFASLDAGFVIFCTGMVLLILSQILFTSTLVSTGYAPILRIGTFLGLALCIFSELFSMSITMGSIMMFAIFAGVSVIAYSLDGSALVYMLVVAFASRHYRFRDLLRVALFTIAFACLLVVAMSILGIIDVVASTTEGSRSRTSMGFGWVTYLSHYYLELVIGYSLLRGSKITIREIVALACVDIAIYLVTDARNSFLLVILFLILMLAYKILTNRLESSKALRIVLPASFVICMIASAVIYLVPNPGAGFGYMLDQLLSSRITQTQRALSLYGLHPFGTEVTWVTLGNITTGQYTWQDYLYVDCSYLNILINYGWILGVAMLSVLTIVAYRATSKSSVLFGFAFAFFAIHGIVDPQLLDLHYCVLLLLLGNIFDSAERWSERLEGFGCISPKSNAVNIRTGINC